MLQLQSKHLCQVHLLRLHCLSGQRVGVQEPSIWSILIFFVLFVSRQKEQRLQQYNNSTSLSQQEKLLCELRQNMLLALAHKILPG